MAHPKLGYLTAILLLAATLAGCGTGASTIRQATPANSAVDVAMTPSTNKPGQYIQENIQAMKQPATNTAPQTPEYQPVSDDVSPAKSRLINIQARNTPLGDILHVIADAAGLNLVISDGVQQDRLITITLKRVTADEALTTLLTSADYFYTIKDNTLTIDATGTKIFELGHPAMVQGYTVEVGGDILGSGASLTTSGGGSSSNIKGTISQSIKSDTKAFDFWESLDKSLQSMIGKRDTAAPRSQTQPSKVETVTRTSAGVTTSVSKTTVERQQDQQQASKSSETTSASEGSDPSQLVVVNRLTGTIMVTATRKNLNKIENYLETLRKTLNRQVLIEARIIEVQLSDELKFGIDWSFLSNIRSFGQLSGGYGAVIGTLSSAIESAAPAFRLGATTTSKLGPISGVLTALKTQGDVKTLSNPRINVMNGQTALLTVGRNQNYVSKVTSTVSGSGDTKTVTFTVDTANVLSGVIIGLAPIINSKGEISMTVTPIVSDLVKLEDKTIGTDPSNQVAISIPTVDLRELSTTVKVRNGELIVIGGLISNKQDFKDDKIPLMGDIPWLGALFTKKDHLDKRTELVVLLQPYLIAND